MNALTIASTALPATLAVEVQNAKALIRARHATATRRAYAADVALFKLWADRHALPALPAAPETVVLFLSALAQEGRKPSTIQRKVAAIRYVHREAGHISPTDAEVVTAAMAGIRRTLGAAPRQAAPATVDKVQTMLTTCGADLAGKRDRALLALGFSGAFRRSELVALRVEDLEETEEGYKVTVRKSKTDQAGEGQTVPVLDGPRLMLKAAINDWMSAAGITEGFLFRRLMKGGKVTQDALTDRSVADIIKAHAGAAGLNPQQFSGHSLRSGFLTSGAMHGASVFKLLEVSRHRKIETLRGYVRNAQLFRDHAAQAFA